MDWTIWKVALATQFLDIIKLILVYYVIKLFERWLKRKKESTRLSSVPNDDVDQKES